LKVTRVLAVLSTILFIAGLGLIMVPLVSVTGLSVSVGNGSATVTNNGYLEVYGLSIHAYVISPSGNVIASGSSVLVDLPPHSSRTISIPVTPNSSVLSYSYVTIKVVAGADLMNVLPATVSFSQVINFSNAIAGLQVGYPEVLHAGNGYIEMQESASFVYNVPYVPLSGTLEVEVSNSTGTVGTASVPVSATQGQAVNLVIPINLSISPKAMLTEEQQFTVSTSLVSGGSAYQIGSQQYTWSPPLYGLSLGSPQATPVNSTYTSMTVPLSFTDMQSSGFSATVNAYLYSSKGQISSYSQSISAVPGSNTVYLKFTFPNTSPTSVVLKINAFNSTFSQEVSLP
jgi:hypothetical protein